MFLLNESIQIKHCKVEQVVVTKITRKLVVSVSFMNDGELKRQPFRYPHCTGECIVCNDQGIVYLFVCLLDLLNEFEFWLAMDSENTSLSFTDQLRRKDVEGMTIEKTSEKIRVTTDISGGTNFEGGETPEKSNSGTENAGNPLRL
jgi:hypothetical protein